MPQASTASVLFTETIKRIKFLSTSSFSKGDGSQTYGALSKVFEDERKAESIVALIAC